MRYYERHAFKTPKGKRGTYVAHIYDIEIDAGYIKVNNKRMRVVNSQEYTYKLCPNKILAKGGVLGLYDFIQRAQRYAECLINDLCAHVTKHGEDVEPSEDWKDVAYEYLSSHVEKFYEDGDCWNDCTTFIDNYWQNGLSNEENLDAFHEWIKEQSDYEKEQRTALCDLLTGKIHRQ